jgi:putative ABC transport system ATP-binding protein
VTKENRDQSNRLVIQTENLWRKYKRGTEQEVAALRGLDMEIETGQFIALMGRSGSGKTTLLNILGGLDYPTEGIVRIFGQDISKLNDKEITVWRRERVGFIFQSFGLTPTFSAYENIELMLRIAGKGAKFRKERTNFCLELVGLKKWKDHRPDELSGGQQQRVAIARALANNPRLILADEPTGELDTTTAREILSLFQKIVREENVTLLMASHDSLVDGYVDKILHLQDGQIS